ncbi:TPA: hypothetical protein RNT04_003257 [Stenotrophomonas maltophilia]|uniref:hypothetical protein n=1 Tax=Stenotrophomonas TaxID=40323 RepID=UPI00113A7795|nr:MULTISPECIES: hypothetical protein [Stenotrophomonas]TGR46386.1 hypothetical protein EN842_26520 [bacterium M00.F.Ca.ET.199.01.1.1]TGT01549.1 hypothetical protein EN820_28675 [bacterium M00.F.Ca.ET.177.01.1.1]TGT59261.1 hypothetical protein EN813_031210 [Mesorhizobium sp. M00.F.Ca.ET.170.01.1.1]TGU10920.1 hypothetical protein EN806_23950 [bacterium M00.F.Ca.ET.163.01.1.1]TGU92557.1 hypothetical protein EN794_033785 [Mesorhizobium sp. M00.F.Ca.ET.151.01.1.1]TGV54886.1 hypothetical protein E
MAGASDASEQSIDVAAVGLNAEREHIPSVGDSLAVVVGELEGDATPGASIGKVLEILAERLERTTCHVQPPDNDSSRSSGVTCGGPDVDSLFPDYTALRQASTPAERDRYGRRFLDAYATLLRDAPDVALTRPSEDEAADGLLHVLFPFKAWDEKLNIPRHDVHFPFVPVCNLVVARAARCPGADQLRREIGRAGDESEQRLLCIKEFSTRQLADEGECPEATTTSP